MSMQFLARDIASRFHHRGALISPEHADIVADLREIATMDLAKQKEAFEATKLEILSSYGFMDPGPQSKPFAYSNGTAIIPIHGLLINRLSWGSSFATGYNFIRSQLQAALDDPEVRGIVFDVNSPGGVCAGCSELAADIAAAEKPTLAVVDSKAYSAAYWLASAADRISVVPSGGVGSVGVVAMHVDFSGMLEDAGLKVSFIHAGAEKVDGNPYQKLSARARASIQRDVDYHYGMFTEAVAKQRGISVESVRETEAACYLPPEALDIGLVDSIETPAAAVESFSSDLSGAGAVSMASNGSSWKCGASRDLSVKESGSWDGPAASERMLDAAGFNGDNPDSAKARRGFLAYDAGDPKKKGSYKLPFADMVDGKLTAVRSGLNAAAQRLSQTDIPQSVKDEAQRVIDHYKPKNSDDSKSEVFEMDENKVQAIVADAVSNALKADRQRQASIRTCEEAKGREKLAEHLALNTEMTVDEAKAILAAAPVEQKAVEPANKGGNPLDAAMNATGGGTGVRPDASGSGGGAQDDTPQARAARILGAWRHESGAKVIDLKPNAA